MRKKHNFLNKLLLILLSIIFIIFVIFYIYSLDYYRADNKAKGLINNSSITKEKNITIISQNNNDDINIGLIFYPGGKVEDISYLPLLNKLSQYGITSFLVKMPFNLAVFNSNAADNIIKKYPNIDKWYIMGHSLGGAMASSYTKKNYDKLDGLILLAAYPLNNALDNTLCIYGSNDYILDQSKLDNVKNKYIIEGGNHAYFGNYGEQKGDGISGISRDRQQEITINLITNNIIQH